MYHVTGLISTGFYIFLILGLWLQLKLIWSKKKQETQNFTAVISLNFISMIFFAYFFVFLYGFSLTEINHYFVWPRLVAMVLALIILYEIKLDRKGLAVWVFYFCIVLFVSSLCIFFFKRNLAQQAILVPQILLMVITFLLMQGNIAQIRYILKNGYTGALSFHYQLFTFCKDISTVIFALTMGNSGWPIVVLCLSSSICKLIIMLLFYKLPQIKPMN